MIQVFGMEGADEFLCFGYFPADIVFDYRQKVTRSFEYLQGDYYIAPLFMVNI